jgi:hypothetical protein
MEYKYRYQCLVSAASNLVVVVNHHRRPISLSFFFYSDASTSSIFGCPEPVHHLLRPSSKISVLLEIPFSCGLKKSLNDKIFQIILSTVSVI